MATWKLLTKLAGRYLWAVPILVMLGLAATAAEAIGLSLLVVLLQIMLGSSSTTMIGGGTGVLDQVYKAAFSWMGESAVIVATVTVGLIVTKSLLIAGYGCLSSALNARLNDRLRTDAFGRLLQADYALVSSQDHGHYQNLITTESLRVTDAIWTALQMLVSLCAIVVFGAMLLLISWQLVLVVAVGTITASVVTRLLVKRATVLSASFSDACSIMMSRVATVLNGMRMVRAFGRERDEARRFEEASDHVRRSFVHLQYLKAATGPISEGLYLAVFIGIVVASTSIATPVASVITFVIILGRLHPQVKNFDWSRVHLSGYRSSIERVADFLHYAPAPVGASGTLRFEGLAREIHFANVSLSYGKDTEFALHSVSFDIPRGRTIAIVGSSGAGKSTITNLLLRLYTPSAGTITADGIAISQYDLASWRAQIAIAGQDADLIDGTVLDNIRYGKPAAPLADVEQAAQAAGILDFIRSLPNGWSTTVGERGLRLSGGQRQRIGLARALLRRPDILILDEATNSLDSLLEGQIQSAVEQLSGKTTIIIIAHRLSSVISADHVIVLWDGSIAEQGTPQELLVRGGVFGRLYAGQNAVAATPSLALHSARPETAGCNI